MTDLLSCSAPGRVCLFGEHQDYLGLTVVPCALNLRCRVSGTRRRDGKFQILDRLHGQRWAFDLDNLKYTGEDSDYLKAVVAAMLKRGLDISGVSAEITNEVPLKSGLSSSAALEVSWAKFLDLSFDLGLRELDLAMISYAAEHDELGIPCGVMDQIASSFGGIVEVQCQEPPLVSRLPAQVEGLVIGDTLVSKRTLDVHSVRTKEIASAISNLESQLGGRVDLTSISWEEIQPYLPRLSAVQRKRIAATVKDRDITQQALELLRKRNPSMEELGELMTQHHMYLRDYYEVSHPRLDALLEAAQRAGALGGKLTGAGFGGCVVVLAPGRERQVADAIRKAGGRPYTVKQDQGARREN